MQVISFSYCTCHYLRLKLSVNRLFQYQNKKEEKIKKKNKPATDVGLNKASFYIVLDFKFKCLLPDPYHLDSRSYLPFEEVYSMTFIWHHKGTKNLKRIIQKVSVRFTVTKPYVRLNNKLYFAYRTSLSQIQKLPQWATKLYQIATAYSDKVGFQHYC